MIHVALLSKWHVHAVDYAAQALDNDNITIKVVWDEDVIRGQQWAKELGVKFESDLHKVLTNQEIDAVIVDTPTNMHKEVIMKAAEQKKHIFTEKVLALTVDDANAILEAVEKNQVKFMISLPRLTENYYLYAQKVVDEGFLGRLTNVRCRVAHNGTVPSENHPRGWLPPHFYQLEECGGGAFVDLGAHPIYLSNRLGGEVTAVTARFKQTFDYEVDDNAVAVVEYASGALGILETGFVSSGSPFQLELYGTEGTLMIEDKQIRLKSNKLEEGWHKPSELPAALPMPMEQWVSNILSANVPTITHKDAINLTLINQAARTSNNEGRRVEIKELI
jgi:predicted dehydrogenase